MPEMLTANFEGVTRFDTMENKDFLVAPMVMITEGVHAGSNGPLFYPGEELGKVPQIWNHKPVVVYHPQAPDGSGVSACDPDILTNHKVGVIMNTRYEGGKLKAEAWLDPERMEAVDNRISEAIEKNQMMEVSTGVYTENEETPGKWKEEEYDAIARNYRPDHLAILPDLKGACSIEDGAGLLRLNAVSHDDIRSLINSKLRKSKENAWIEEVYDESFIYEDGGNYYRQEYDEDEGEISFVGVAEQVTKNIVWKNVVTGKTVLNVSFERNDEMKKKRQIVDDLIANEKTQWDEEHRESLMGLDKTILLNMAPVENEDEPNPVQESAKAGAGDTGTPAETPAETPPAETPAETPPGAPDNPEAAPAENKAQTVTEYINNAPAEMRDVLRTMKRSHDSEKKKLIDIITDNDRNTFTENQLKDKSLEELRQLAELAAVTNEQKEELREVNFGGQSDPVENVAGDEEPLGTPTINYQEEKKKAS
jgi:hypothetical protein